MEGVFYGVGKLIYRFRWLIIFLWLILFIACLPLVPQLTDPMKSIGFVDPNSQSAKADIVLNSKFGYGINQFIIIYNSEKLKATDPLFQEEIKKSLAQLKNDPKKHEIIYPDANNKTQISKDKHTAYAVVAFKNEQELNSTDLAQIKSAIKKPAHLNMKVGGEPIFLDDTKKQTQNDLFRAEYIAVPVAIITMLIIFGSVVAASMPIILGGVGAIFILTILFFLAHIFDLSVFTINIALLLGLCLTLDYSLFIINRFREEIRKSQTIDAAIAKTLTTAGKAIFFSGLAVFISLSALLLFPINVLFSVGLGGLTATFISAAIAIILLPSILAVLNTKINYLSIPFLNKRKNPKRNFWRLVVSSVIRNRKFYFVAILIFLLFIGYPFLHVKFGISDFTILPKQMESRQVFDTFKEKFGETKLAPIFVMVHTTNKVLTTNNINHLYDLANQIKKDPRVDSISGLVNTDPRLTKQKYAALYTHPQFLNPEIKKFIRLTARDNLTVFTIISKYPHDSVETKQLVKTIRAMQPGHGFSLQVTGTSVKTIDVLAGISRVFPYALLWIIGFSYLILLLLLRSVILPLKAIAMTILSLFASYGVLVFVIQYGHFHHLLNFEPQHILDISLLIIIFCTLFGVSMDYEVFLLTRIKEDYEETGDNIKSILVGIDHSSKIITSAAIIVIVLCLAFMSADILIVKAFGLGIAVAVFIDAFLIRTILVPATMALLKSWNWYLPKWLDRILPNV
jgi:uncharacterized membrane protein YdfJ with MMPL/SSD domain